MKQFLTEIWNAKQEAERICAKKETLTQWVEELVAAHPDESEYWVLATDLDNQLGLTRASVAVELPVQVVQVENDRVDENEQNNENELDLLVQEVENESYKHLFFFELCSITPEVIHKKLS